VVCKAGQPIALVTIETSAYPSGNDVAGAVHSLCDYAAREAAALQDCTLEELGRKKRKE
jgi:hypothetical protein